MLQKNHKIFAVLNEISISNIYFCSSQRIRGLLSPWTIYTTMHWNLSITRRQRNQDFYKSFLKSRFCLKLPRFWNRADDRSCEKLLISHLFAALSVQGTLHKPAHRNLHDNHFYFQGEIIKGIWLVRAMAKSQYSWISRTVQPLNRFPYALSLQWHNVASARQGIN